MKQCNNIEAEKAVLGAILLKWESLGDIVSSVQVDDFYDTKHQFIYKSMLSLYNAGINGDMLTIVDSLTKSNELDKAGGITYISTLTDTVPTSSNIKYYSKIITDNSVRRNIIKIADEMKAETADESIESRTILERVDTKLFQLTDTHQTSHIETMQNAVTKTIALIDERYRSKGAYTGVPCGFDILDGITSGFQNSDYIIIGARPAMGKTAFALSMIENILNKGIPCGFFSLEMPTVQIMQRLLSQTTRIPQNKLRSGMLKMADFQRLQESASRLFDSKLYIVDTPNMRMLDIRTMARRMKSKYDIKILFIDYIGLITSENSNAPVYEQQSAISKSLKALARELNIPIVVLCQVGRNSEGNQPTLADIRGSGSIEQDADMVMFIHGDRSEDSVQDRKLVVAKNRNGQVANIDLVFLSECTRFENKEVKLDEKKAV